MNFVYLIFEFLFTEFMGLSVQTGSFSNFTPRERETRLAVDTALMSIQGKPRNNVSLNEDSDVDGPMAMILKALQSNSINSSFIPYPSSSSIENKENHLQTRNQQNLINLSDSVDTDDVTFTESDAEFISKFFTLCSFGRGSIIWEMDQKPDFLYIVEQGELELLITDNGRLRVIETLICGIMVKMEGDLEFVLYDL
jgi:hypothetical protein